jgi:CheY-like chemotaxis protein
VLVVEDYADARHMYAEYLQHCGFLVEEAGDGEAAVEMCRAWRPDVVVMDLALPRLDGFEAIRQMRLDEATSGVRILALTGHLLPDAEQRARAAGCDGFLAKPCLPDELLSAVTALAGGADRQV